MHGSRISFTEVKIQESQTILDLGVRIQSNVFFFAYTPGTEAQKTSTDDTLLEAEYKLFLWVRK